MAEKIWVIEQKMICEHIGEEVVIEEQVVIPAEFMPDQPMRVVARRCSHAIQCNQIDHPVCSLCGTNPGIEPVK